MASMPLPRSLRALLPHGMDGFTALMMGVFGLGSWIAINGLFAELPLVVDTLPEGWAIASYCAVAVQLANIGPITYAAVKHWQVRVV